MRENSFGESESIELLLGPQRRPLLSKRSVLLLLAVSVVLLGAVLAAGVRARRNGSSAQFVTRDVRKGNLVVTVSATGTLQPVNQVDVGSELSGTVERVLVEENGQVKKGQILAVLQTTKLEEQVARSRAALASARARKLQGEASVAQARARLSRLKELEALTGGKSPSQYEIETAEASLSSALAETAVGEASVQEAIAALAIDETNLKKAVITSPVNGVVLTRSVEPGQTVAATLQSPVLFTLAEDLAKMELEVDINEADAGTVREGQTATFNVDAYPGRVYEATVVRVGLGSRIKENVVSYRTILTVANDDTSLRPGMTASVEITTAKRENVLLVPNAALRFQLEAQPQKPASRSIVSRLLPAPPMSPRTNRNLENGASRVYKLVDGVLEAVPVAAGVSDGKETEIKSQGLQPGMQVVTEMSSGVEP